jgi:hypothetical protein
MLEGDYVEMFAARLSGTVVFLSLNYLQLVEDGSFVAEKLDVR